MSLSVAFTRVPYILTPELPGPRLVGLTDPRTTSCDSLVETRVILLMISKFNDCNRNSRVTQGKTLFTDCSSLPNGRHRGIGKVDDQSRVIAKSTQNPCLLLWFDAPSDTVAPPLAEAQRAKLELPLQNVLVLIHSCAGAAFLT